MEECIRFEHVSKHYGSLTVLNDFDLTIYKGEFITIIGRSGCGKTTVLRLINGLLSPDKGAIYVNGKDVAASDLIELRRSIGYAIQNIGLFPHMTVEKNIAYVPSLSKRWSKVEEVQQIKDLLSVVGLDTSIAHRYPRELSGGQQQRVGIARALAAGSQILLMDEPFGAVDEITRRSLQKEILQLQKDLGITIVFITHDIKEALLLGSRVLIMDEGNIVQLDTPEQLKTHPANAFVRELIFGQESV